MTKTTAEDAKVVLQAEKAERIDRVSMKIKQLLADERCQIVPVVILTHGNVTATVEINALD